MAATKDQIISEIQRTAETNGGTPLGQSTFEQATGISTSVWRGKYWRTWGDAVKAAGFEPNTKNEAYDQAFLVLSLARLARKNKRFPTYADARLEREFDKAFPAHQALSRLGSLEERIELVRQFVSDHPDFTDVLDILPPPDETTASQSPPALQDGFVYMGLLQIGREKRYKIGKTTLVDRRKDQISLQLPEDLVLVHYIRTDDATGIEKYWHERFAARRNKGEWFSLTNEDVKIFKRRKSFM